MPGRQIPDTHSGDHREPQAVCQPRQPIAGPVRRLPPARREHVARPLSDLFCAISTRISSRKYRPECATRHSRTRRSERMWKMEGLFAEAKQNHGLSRARYRGRSKVQIQAYLSAIVQNLKRLVAALSFWLTIWRLSRHQMHNPDHPPCQNANFFNRPGRFLTFREYRSGRSPRDGSTGRQFRASLRDDHRPPVVRRRQAVRHASLREIGCRWAASARPAETCRKPDRLAGSQLPRSQIGRCPSPSQRGWRSSSRGFGGGLPVFPSGFDPARTAPER